MSKYSPYWKASPQKKEQVMKKVKEAYELGKKHGKEETLSKLKR